MKTWELIERLSGLSEEQKQLPICVEDGCDPSDPTEVTGFEIRSDGRPWFEFERYLKLN